MADVVVLNDPLTSQGSNNAIKSASFYLEAITAHEGAFDAGWMQRTFDNFWRGWAQWATEWTNSWLRPAAPHQRAVVDAAARHPAIAAQVAAGFDDARLFSPWWFDAGGRGRVRRGGGPRRGRRGSTPATCAGPWASTPPASRSSPPPTPTGERFGMTANSFTSVSLNPPLVLWAAAQDSPSLAAFEASDAVRGQRAGLRPAPPVAAVLHLRRRQVRRRPAAAPGDPPLLEGTVARFVCRRLPGDRGRLDAGDHVLFLGEIESYDAPGGEPLVFHSGFYRLATKHPDL